MNSLVAAVLAARERFRGERAFVVGLSGVDASGKGYITARLSERLKKLGRRVVTLCADDWLDSRDTWSGAEQPAEVFYERAFRFDELFAHLARLKEDGTEFLLLEGIFLFKREYRRHFDLRVWIDCSFKTALERAIVRRQEGLGPDETRRAFEALYFPAQRIHFGRDQPQDCADVVFGNDRK